MNSHPVVRPNWKNYRAKRFLCFDIRSYSMFSTFFVNLFMIPLCIISRFTWQKTVSCRDLCFKRRDDVAPGVRKWTLEIVRKLTIHRDCLDVIYFIHNLKLGIVHPRIRLSLASCAKLVKQIVYQAPNLCFNLSNICHNSKIWCFFRSAFWKIQI